MSGRAQLCRGRRPDAPLRLYCLPHSGGSAGEYLFWSDELPGVEVWGIQPPGRGNRIDEDPHTTMADLAGAIAGQVEFTPPYVLFGHSLGAAVGYEVTRLLHERGAPLPDRLYVSAHEAPHLHRGDAELPGLGDLALLDAVGDRYAALPDEVRDDPEWRALVLRALRADLRVVADYTAAARPPLPVPIVALGGADDDISEADLRAWAAHTRAGFTLRVFPGGHFYFREHERDFFDFLGADTVAGAAR